MEIFTPFFGAHASAKFIAGFVGETSVVVMLGGAYPFEADPPNKWNEVSQDGWVISRLRFEVDQASAAPLSPAKRGKLVVTSNGTLFVNCLMNNQLQAVRLDSEERSEVDGYDLAFGRWRIVYGPENQPIEIFAYEAAIAA